MMLAINTLRAKILKTEIVHSLFAFLIMLVAAKKASKNISMYNPTKALPAF